MLLEDRSRKKAFLEGRLITFAEMAREKSIKARKWEAVQKFVDERFDTGEAVGVNDIVYLIGLQELGATRQRFKKDDKINLMHIGVCMLLAPYGYYRFTGRDPEGWPHFELLDTLPPLKAGEQQVLIKEAILQYFDRRQTLSCAFREIESAQARVHKNTSCLKK